MKMRPFELALVAFFAVLVLVAVALLALYSPPPDPDASVIRGEVLVWGTLPAAPINNLLDELGRETPSLRNIQYEYVAPEDFTPRFIEALADRTNPDVVLLSHEELIPQRDRLLPYSYDALSLRDFRDRYIDGAEIFALRDGVYGFPIAIDPLLMYWNRALFADANLLSAPTSWEQVVRETVPRLTKRDFTRTIDQSALAFGESTNIQNLTPILSMLMLQAGSRGVVEGENQFVIGLDDPVEVGAPRPLTSALEFFMRFSDSTVTDYTWNRALPLDRDAFAREELALYFGFASEARDLLARNPNLNIDVSEVPKGATTQTRRTYGRVYALSVVRNANNLAGAYGALNLLAAPENANRLAFEFGMAPATRAGLAMGTNDLYGRVAFTAAPAVRGWLMPGYRTTTQIFAETVTRAAQDRSQLSSAAPNAVRLLQVEY
jgi:ABC-type glycerol-3-phosphate transport system substrate-binding protein